MAKTKTVNFISVRDLPQSLLDQIKKHLRDSGIPNPSNNDAIHHACTQFVKQILEASSASAA